MARHRRYSDIYDPRITRERLSARVIEFLTEHFPSFQRDGVSLISSSAVEIDFSTACVFSELYPLARVMQVVGYNIVDNTHFEKPCVNLSPTGVWGINNCNTFETFERLDDVLEHIFLTRLRPAAFITVRNMLDRVLAFFAQNESCFPLFDPSSVTVCSDRSFPRSNFEYSVMRIDDDTVLSVHNDWNIPLSDLTVYTIQCSIQRVRKRRRDCVVVTDLERVDQQLRIMFADDITRANYVI